MIRLKKIAALYSRVSSLNEAQELSYELQQKYHNEDFDIIHKYNDKGKTGTNMNRPAFKGLILDAGIEILELEDEIFFKIVDKPKFEVIIVANSSRFMRNSILHKRIIDKLHQNNVRIFYADINRYSNEPNFGLVLDILFSLDQAYSEQLSEKVNIGMERARNEGRFVVTKMYGYNYIKKENKLVINPEEAEVVRNLFNDYIGGLGTRLLSEKYPFGKSTIVRMLQNEKYTGRVYGKPNKNIERIVSDEVFNEAQKCREERTVNDMIGKKHSTHCLSTKIKCSHCGSSYGVTKGKYLSCIGKNNKGKDFCDSSNTQIEEVFLDLKSYLIVLPSWIKRAFRDINTKYQRIDLNSLELNIKAIEDKLERLLDLYSDGELPKDKYYTRRDKLKEELDILEDKYSSATNLNVKIDELNKLESGYLELIDGWKNLSRDELFNELESVETVTKFYADENRSYAEFYNWKLKKFKTLYELLERERG